MSSPSLPLELHALLQTESSYVVPRHDYPPALHAFRQQIAPWIYRLTESFDLAPSWEAHSNQDLAAATLNCLDRFVASLHGCPRRQADPQHYRLAALTCLYTIVKVHCVKSLSIELLSEKVACGQFSTQLMEQMEMQILHQLQWKIHPVTPMEFVSRYLQVLYGEDRPRHVRMLQELCSIQAHTAVQQLDDITRHVKPSHVALAALANAMECVDDNSDNGDTTLLTLRTLEELADVIQITPGEFVRLRRQLFQSVADHDTRCSATGATLEKTPAPSRERFLTSSTSKLQRLQRQDSPRSILTIDPGL